jgi:cytochrome c oxidase subunit 2
MQHQWLPFWPHSAALSSHAVDTLYIGELALTLIILGFVFGLMILFGVRYRRGSSADRSHQVKKTWHWEIAWTTATLGAFLALFVWGADLYVHLYKVPPHTDLEVYVVGKQWMWKVQHPGGQREIDQLHVPVDRTVRVVLASEDVIHSFFIPAFRLKHDVVPGQYETFWFKATEKGTFRLECSEYCGTQHAHMIGQVIVMAPADYQRWLTSQGVSQTLAQQGEALFRHYGCSGCHGANSPVHAPSLVGLYGSIVHLQDGGTAVADERYIRDSILLPTRQIVAGYAPIMPSFAGQIGEDDLLKIVSYIQSLSSGQGTSP